MNKLQRRALVWGIAIALYLRFGLEPTGWLFYEMSHALSVDWLYWGYSAFRGGAYALSLWDYQLLACIAAGLLVAAIILWRGRGKEQT